MYCRKCGAQIPDDSTFCPKCGEKCLSTDEFKESNVSSSSKDTNTDDKTTTQKTQTTEPYQVDTTPNKTTNIGKIVGIVIAVGIIAVIITIITSVDRDNSTPPQVSYEETTAYIASEEVPPNKEVSSYSSVEEISSNEEVISYVPNEEASTYEAPWEDTAEAQTPYSYLEGVWGTADMRTQYTFAKDMTMRIQQVSYNNVCYTDICTVNCDNSTLYYSDAESYKEPSYWFEEDKLVISNCDNKLWWLREAPETAVPVNDVESLEGVYFCERFLPDIGDGYYIFKHDGTFAYIRYRGWSQSTTPLYTGRYEITGNMISIFVDNPEALYQYMIEVRDEYILLFTQENTALEGYHCALQKDLFVDDYIVNDEQQEYYD